MATVIWLLVTCGAFYAGMVLSRMMAQSEIVDLRESNELLLERIAAQSMFVHQANELSKEMATILDREEEVTR